MVVTLSLYKAMMNLYVKYDNQEKILSALCGCGAYAFNLAAHVKRKGKKGITLCGGLQTLFGIYGARHEEDFKKFGILNEYWVRPRSNERPSGFQNVENGAYW